MKYLLESSSYLRAIPEYYQNTLNGLEALNLLNIQANSAFFRKIRLELLNQIQTGQIELYGFRLRLSPALIRRYATAIEPPINIVRFRKLISLLERFENIFLKVEQLVPRPEASASWSKRVWNLSIISKNVISSVVPIWSDSLQHELDELVDELLSFVGKEIVIHLKALPTISALIDNQFTYFTQHSQRTRDWILWHNPHPEDWLKNMALFIGSEFDLMNPNNLSMSFIPQVLGRLPHVLNLLHEYLKSSPVQEQSEHLSHFERNALKKRADNYERELNIFKQRADDCVRELNEMVSGQPRLMLLLNYRFIFQLRTVIDLSKSLFMNIGKTNAKLQDKLKALIKILINDLFREFNSILNDLEIQFRLEPGQLSNLIFPQLNDIYQQVMVWSKDYVSYSPEEDKQLECLRDAHWSEYDLDANRAKQVEVAVELEKFDADDRHVGVAGVVSEAKFMVFAPYLQELDPEEYNLGLDKLRTGQPYTWSDALLNRLKKLRDQYKAEALLKRERLIEQQEYLEKLRGNLSFDKYFPKHEASLPLLDNINEHQLLGLQMNEVINLDGQTLDKLKKMQNAYMEKKLRLENAQKNLIRMHNLIQMHLANPLVTHLRHEDLVSFQLNLTCLWSMLTTEQKSDYYSKVKDSPAIDLKKLQNWFIDVFPVMSGRIKVSIDENKNRLGAVSAAVHTKLLSLFDTLQFAERAEYYLPNTEASKWVKTKIEDRLNQAKGYFSPKILKPKVFKDDESWSFAEEVLDVKDYLTYPRQLLEPKILFDSSKNIKKLLTDLEAIKKKDVKKGLIGLLQEKTPLIQTYLNAQNYGLRNEFSYTWSHLKAFYQSLQTIKNNLQDPVKKYGLAEKTMAENLIHFFLNGSEIIQSDPETPAALQQFKMRLEKESSSIYSKVQQIIQALNSYLKLMGNVSNIYIVSSKIKKQYRKLPATIFEKNKEILPTLKLNLFGEMMCAVDALELSLALNPDHISKPVAKAIDDVFENYLVGQNLNVVAFTQLCCDDSLERKRLAFYKAEDDKSKAQMAIEKENYRCIQNFLRDLATKPLSDLQQRFTLQVAPLISEFSSWTSKETSVPELRTALQLAQDRQFSEWHRSTISYTDYAERIKLTGQVLRGRIETESLRQTLLEDKIERVQARIQEKASPEFKLAHLERYYDNYTDLIVRQYEQHFSHMKHELIPKLKLHFAAHRTQDLEQMKLNFLDELKNTTNLSNRISVIDQYITNKFKTHLHGFKNTQAPYLALESISTLLVSFETYLGKLDAQDLFEDSKTKALKSNIVARLKGIAANSEWLPPKRLDEINRIMTIHAKNLLSCKTSDGGWLAQCFLILHQFIVEVLAYFGFWHETNSYHQTKSWVKQLQQPETGADDKVAKLSDFNLFKQINLSRPTVVGLPVAAAP